jgi:methionyl-tRNA formyltransferase
VLKTVEKIERNDIKTSAQPTNEELIAAPKIFKETCQIDWRREAGEINNFVRGLSPYPGAWTNVGGKQCKIFRIGLFQGESNLSIGEFKTDQKSFVHVGCKDGTISLVDFQLEGKRKMNISDFFRGNKIQI